MKKGILCTFIALLFLSCSNDDASNEGISVLYNQTFCADPWGYADDNSELASKINVFFENKTIEILHVKIDTKGTQQECNACICLSGKRIIVNVNKADLDAIKAYGFQ